MSKSSKEGVHIIYKDSKPVAMFKRDEESGKNVIYSLSEAPLDFIESLFLSEKKV